MNVFLAGATGVLGRALVPMLIAAGHRVTGTTRRADRAEALQAAGVTPAIVDFFNRDAVLAAVLAAKPDVIVHELTDLPTVRDPATFEAALRNNARLRIEATPHLVAAAEAAGVRRIVAQSAAFAYAPGPLPYDETAPLDHAATGTRKALVEAIGALERLVTATASITGFALRYGYFYGPGTWADRPEDKPSLHVDAAARAALLALTHGARGAYNIADDDGFVSIAKARRDLGFDPAFRAGERRGG